MENYRFKKKICLIYLPCKMSSNLQIISYVHKSSLTSIEKVFEALESQKVEMVLGRSKEIIIFGHFSIKQQLRAFKITLSIQSYFISYEANSQLFNINIIKKKKRERNTQSSNRRGDLKICLKLKHIFGRSREFAENNCM